MKYSRAIHRAVMVVVVVVTLYLSVTGTMIQLVDLRSIFTKAPASDPNVEAMHEAFYGPGNYAVIAVTDYTAPALPEGADLAGMLSRTMESARLTVGDVPLRYVEVRMADGKPVGVVESAGRVAEFDATTGQIISAGPARRPDPDSPDSLRNTWKHLHRMTTFGNYALFINVIVGVGLGILIITGLIIYFKMLSGRSGAGLSSPFWSGGGWWRTWHRRISVVAALFLLVVTLSGLWLAYESLYFGFYMGSAQQRANTAAFAAAQRQRNPPQPRAPRVDPLSEEAAPKRLAAMKHDIGLTDDEAARMQAINEEFVKQNEGLQKAAGDPQELRGKTEALHTAEATAMLAALTDDEKPKFQAWRDAQLLGTPVNAGGRGNGGQQRAGGQPGGGGQPGAGGQPGPAAPNGANRAAGTTGGAGAAGAAGGNGGGGGGPVDTASPLKDADIPGMMQVTLDSERSDKPNVPIKVVRLRIYAGMPQGVVVTGGDTTKQMVFNASTGRAVSETEPGYPPTGFPFGWQAHQTAKDVHRGGIVGLTGRFMDLFAGLSMFYLSASGIWIYCDLWKRRKEAGKSKLVWV
jgi:uncharacterized iron-regulated membrane protein